MSIVISDSAQTLNVITKVLTIIGAINWGMIGIADIDLVKLLFHDTIITQVIYITVGIAGIIQLLQFIFSIQQRIKI